MHAENTAIRESKPMKGILVGSPLCFSDTILKVSNDEMDCIQFTRLNDLSDLTKLISSTSEDQRGSFRNILVDEAMIDPFCAGLDELRTTIPDALFALAYRQQHNAQTLMERSVQNPPLRQVSLLPMHLEVDRWLSVLRLLICGEHFVPSDLMVAQIQGNPTSNAPTALPAQKNDEDKLQVRLTVREIQVLKSAAEGKPNKIIAEELSLSQHTIKLHMHHLMAKLGVHNRTEAANWFFDHQNEVARP